MPTVAPRSSPTAARPTALKNRYFVCPIYQNEPDQWNPYTRDRVLKHSQLDYLGRMFEILEQTTEVEGLTIYVTWRVDVLPSYGPDVVAIVLGDEWGRYPLYTSRVRAVFKMLGADFPLDAMPLRTPPLLTAVTTAKFARTQVLRVPHLLRKWWDRAVGAVTGQSAHLFDIPLGYYSQDDLPVKPLNDREYDLYFSGSLCNARYPWYRPQFWLRTPKDVARSSLVRAMREIRDDRPNLTVFIDAMTSYAPNGGKSASVGPEQSYSEMMMNTRVCPVPRGTRLETARLYEALRYGCVLVTEPLPDRWFLTGLPHVVVDDWAELPAVVDELVADPDRMQVLHEASLTWWRERCSEGALAHFIGEKLGDPSLVPNEQPDAAVSAQS